MMQNVVKIWVEATKVAGAFCFVHTMMTKSSYLFWKMGVKEEKESVTGLVATHWYLRYRLFYLRYHSNYGAV